jgi:hypothetical protein
MEEADPVLLRVPEWLTELLSSSILPLPSRLRTKNKMHKVTTIFGSSRLRKIHVS